MSLLNTDLAILLIVAHHIAYLSCLATPPAALQVQLKGGYGLQAVNQHLTLAQIELQGIRARSNIQRRSRIELHLNATGQGLLLLHAGFGLQVGAVDFAVG